MSTIRIGILRGGPSHEHEASILTGQNIAKCLEDDSRGRSPDTKKYLTTDIFIDKKGTWHIGGIPKLPIEAIHQFDVIVNALHGSYGEDGTVQKILDVSGVPYVGNSVYSSVTTHHKGVFKKKLKEIGIKTPIFREFNLSVADDLSPIARELFSSFPLPAIVKPQSGGGSIGVGIATNFDSLFDALRGAVQYSNDVIVEEFIPGTEIVSGFVDGLRGEETYILLPVSISTDEKKTSKINSMNVTNSTNLKSNLKSWIGHLDSVARHMGKYTVEIPHEIKDSHKKEIADIIKKVKSHIGLRHFASFDFILSPRRGLYLIESDSSPQLTEKSPFMTSLKEAGIHGRDFFRHIINTALRK